MTEFSQPDPSNASDTQPSTARTGYRCVCGDTLLVADEISSCPNCGRLYDESVLRSATAETTALDAGRSGSSPQQPPVGSDDPLNMVGRHLGHFKILAPIGRGGMGAVYRALDESLERFVAVKVLKRAAVGGDVDDLQRLFQEARAQARVNDPNVAHIYYVGRDDDTPYLAMELVGHQTLGQLMRDGPLPFAQVIHYSIQIASALNAAAKFDIIHGDVKPANVLMVDHATVKLSDFGLASQLSEATADATTAVGTPDYMPPEATTGKRIDHRGDMYSLGVTMFEMAFGRLPYAPSGDDIEAQLRHHRESVVAFPEPWPSELPQGLRELLETLLEKDPTHRFDDFDQVMGQLRRLAPTSLPGASPLLRAFAWIFDLILIGLPLTIIALLDGSESSLLVVASSTLVLSAFSALQAVWGTTPGKSLVQIRIVDRHGLRPTRTTLGTRAVFQFSLAWLFVAGGLLSLLGLSFIGTLLSAAVALFVLVEMTLVMLRQGRSIHDQLFGTCVVLDAGVR